MSFNLQFSYKKKLDIKTIFLIQVPSFELKGKLKGHFGIVYDLSWSKRDTHLSSASSDGTVR